MSEQCKVPASQSRGFRTGDRVYIRTLKRISRWKRFWLNLFNRPHPTEEVEFTVSEVTNTTLTIVPPIAKDEV